MPAITYFDSWVQYTAEILHLPGGALPTVSQYRFMLTAGASLTRTMSKAEIISAELLPTNGYSRKAYNPASGVWDAAQLRYELAPVTVNIEFTATEQWNGMVLWSNSVADSAIRTVTAANVNASTDRLTITGHGLTSAQEVVVTSTGARPGGLAANTIYFVQVVDTNTIALHTSATLNALVNITDAGTGTHHLRLAGGRPVCFVNYTTQVVGAGTPQPLRLDLSFLNAGDVNGV